MTPPAAPVGKSQLVIATWNIHGCVGRDGRERPECTAEVIAELGADVVALQEVWCRGTPHGVCAQPALLAGVAGFGCVLGITLRRGDDHYGNVLLVRHPPLRVTQVDLSKPRREPRGAIDAAFQVGDAEVRIIATHLGLDLGERRHQVDRLLAIIDGEGASTVNGAAAGAGAPASADGRRNEARGGAAVLAVLGDFNDWLPGRSAAHALDHRLGRCVRLPTWPGSWPLLPLDRIWARPCEALRDVHVHRSRTARAASDHLPVVGTLVV